MGKIIAFLCFAAAGICCLLILADAIWTVYYQVSFMLWRP